MIGYRVLGFDLTVATADGPGRAELDVTMPLIAHHLCWSLHILARGVQVSAARCVRGLEADPERCRWWLEASAVPVTAPAPYIGCEAAARVCQERVATGRRVPEIVLQTALLPEERLRRILAPETVTEPGIPRGGPHRRAPSPDILGAEAAQRRRLPS